MALRSPVFKMSNSVVHRLLKQAMKTFSNGQPKGLNVLKTDTVFAENLAEIVKLTSSVTPEDVYFDSNLVRYFL